jgi:hypothetical protein
MKTMYYLLIYIKHVGIRNMFNFESISTIVL